MTLADWVGACAATLAPLVEEIEKHVLTAERIHADDTTVPVLAKTQCVAGRAVPLLARSRPREPRAPSRHLLRHHAGRRLLGLQRALRSGPQARPDYRSRLLGTWAAKALVEKPGRQSHRLQPQAMGRLHAVPGRWPHLPIEQCRRARRSSMRSIAAR